jgi:hypothetical protein
MRITQATGTEDSSLSAWLNDPGASAPDLVIVNWAREPLDKLECLGAVRQAFPRAVLAGCSSSGDIYRDHILDQSWIMTGIHFENSATRCLAVDTNLENLDDAKPAGERLAGKLPVENLRLVLLFSPGLGVNGDALVEGLTGKLPQGVSVFGGLAGDNAHYFQTYTLGPSGIAPRQVVAVGLYGQHLQPTVISGGGWQPFGLRRKITRAQGSRLYELDGQPVLGLYKRYLGPYASGLPVSGLLFPLEILDGDDTGSVLRSIYGVDEATQSILLAGSVKEGTHARLMLTSPDTLVMGAEVAAREVRQAHGKAPELVYCVSCVGRKLMMGERTEEEILAIRDVLGEQAPLAGFYSNGEIASVMKSGVAKFHNQTMTMLLLSEDLPS